jgi:zinc transporter ZupT
LRLAVIGGSAGFATTALGALPALVLRGLPQRIEDSLLGMAAGMMLAASAFSLLLPGLDAGASILGSKPLGAGVVVVGMALGVALMLGLDAFIPHEHDKTGPCGPGYERCSRIWLFVFAIAVHNLPEGMAIGVSFSQADMAVGLPLTTAIALQDIPEGLASKTWVSWHRVESNRITAAHSVMLSITAPADNSSVTVPSDACCQLCAPEAVFTRNPGLRWSVTGAGRFICTIKLRVLRTPSRLIG